MKKIILLFALVASNLFTYSQSNNCATANPICSGSYNFPSIINTSSIGSIGCLTVTPNSNWSIIKVSLSGQLNFSIHQGNNSPSYNNNDIDYICWGPFSTIPNCDTQLYGFPISNTSIPNNIFSCSYASSSTESFSIPNANLGSYYIILTSNFSNQSGVTVIEQTNVNEAGAGFISCDFNCNISLGTENGIFPGFEMNTLEICSNEVTSIVLKTYLEIIPTDTSSINYEWFLNDVLQPGLTTQEVTIGESGIWKVKVTNPLCNNTPEDSVNVHFETQVELNPHPNLNGPINNCNPTFDLTQTIPTILGTFNPSEYIITFYTETEEITNPSNFSINTNTIVYAIAMNQVSGCTSSNEINFLLDIDCDATELIINTHPQDQTINLNDTATFTTNITNITNFTTYEWQMSTDGNTWTTITNGGVNPIFTGANTNTLTLNNIPSNYNGNMFRVIATSPTDTKTSNPANLSIVLSNDNYELSVFSIFPNPTFNNFILKINSHDLSDDLKYSIYDINGRKLLSNKVNSLETIIPFEMYKSGIYFIEIITSSEKSTKKLIKQ